MHAALKSSADDILKYSLQKKKKKKGGVGGCGGGGGGVGGGGCWHFIKLSNFI